MSAKAIFQLDVADLHLLAAAEHVTDTKSVLTIQFIHGEIQKLRERLEKMEAEPAQ